MKIIKPGQYFETGSILTKRQAGLPRLCVEVKGARVYYQEATPPNDKYARARAEGDTRAPSFCSINSVGIICDTLDELLEVTEAAKQSRLDLEIANRENLIALKRKLSEINAKHQPNTEPS